MFIDEVQECSEVVTFIKYLVEREGFTFILSGSLLGVELDNARSLPVGYLSVLDMHPLDFEEFCWGLGVGEEALCHARDCFAESRPVIEPVHQRMLSLFHPYLMVGGMPAAVTRFLETGSIAEVKKVQDDIVRLYRADISKYARSTRPRCISEKGLRLDFAAFSLDR